jgi:mitochondrial chaperone BCS1
MKIAVVLKLIRQMLSGQNQFASGGLLLMIVGAVGVFLRSLPLHLWSWLTYQCTMLLTINDDDTAFDWMKEWFLEQPFLKKVRWLDVDTSLRGDEASLIPAPGRHRFWYGGRPFWVWFTRKEDAVGWTPRRMESLTFRTIGRDTRLLEKFVGDVVACHESKQRTASCLYQYDERWCYVHAYAPRRLGSVILKPNEKEDLVNDVRQFRESRERYGVLGVPYHRGYLLYGPPGTGKTSLVSGLAAEFGMSIYAINLTELSDQKLKRAVSTVPENSVILFEDIDCMKVGGRRLRIDDESQRPRVAEEAKSEPGDRYGVTLSGLLNVLDGFHAPENVLFLMTTNKIEALDTALLRPGRIDYRLYMGRATAGQKAELYRRFFPLASLAEAQIFVTSHGHAETMAEFQGLLLGLEETQNQGDVQVVLEFDLEAPESVVA